MVVDRSRSCRNRTSSSNAKHRQRLGQETGGHGACPHPAGGGGMRSNQSHAAEILDIDRVTLYHKLKKYAGLAPRLKHDKASHEAATPVADRNVDDGLVKDLRPASKNFPRPRKVLPSVGSAVRLPRRAQQYHSSEILYRMQSFVNADPGACWALRRWISTSDSNVRVRRAQMVAPAPCLSPPVASGTLWASARPELFRQRVIKEAVHELGTRSV